MNRKVTLIILVYNSEISETQFYADGIFVREKKLRRNKKGMFFFALARIFFLLLFMSRNFSHPFHIDMCQRIYIQVSNTPREPLSGISPLLAQLLEQHGLLGQV